jgi:hypothetical protein
LGDLTSPKSIMPTPQKIKPDQIVQFSDKKSDEQKKKSTLDDDDDDAWRWDK